MRYLFAILIPPAALFMCRKPVQGILNLLIWLVSLPAILFFGLGLIGWAFCTLHAVIVCAVSSADRRMDRLVKAIEKDREPVQA